MANGLLRKTLVLLFLAGVWEIYAVWLNNPLLFPTFSATVEAFFAGLISGKIILGDLVLYHGVAARLCRGPCYCGALYRVCQCHSNWLRYFGDFDLDV